MELDRDEWLRRYRLQLERCYPGIFPEMLEEIAGIEAHEALSAEYPHNPEKAVDDELDEDSVRPERESDAA